MDEAVAYLEEVIRGDLERCAAAIRADDKAGALSELESAFAKLDTVLDMVRSAAEQMQPGLD